ncbi:MAG: GIY-YIG nuclease family protein, partial [Selenomonadaceae bacterium]|nr:GIY-YIG nuclease family protein [Selenomonadaceae bacterium]
MNFEDAFKDRLIYIFTIDDAAHKGLLKIGETTLKSQNISLEQAARNRIKQYTNTAGVNFNLLHTELAVKNNGQTFRDYDVHRVLKKYKIKIKGSSAREWFKVDLNTAINAIKAVKRDKKKL